MSFLTRLAIGRPAITMLIAVFAMIGGGYAATRLNAELIPEIDFPMVTIATVYPGAGPDDVAEQVSRPLEEALAGLPGLRSRQSTSASDISLIVVEFVYGTDMKKAEATIDAKLASIALPDGAQKPRVARVDPNAFPVVRLSVSGDGELAALESLVRSRLVPALSAVAGVDGVAAIGVAGRRISVQISPAKAKDKGVSVQQIAGLLEANNVTLPGGNVTVGGEQVPVRTAHAFGSLEEIGDLVVGVSATAGAPAPSGGLADGSPPAAAAAVQPAGRQQTPPAAGDGYVVKGGDTLTALARRFGTTVQALADANRLANPDLILAGQPLVIPLAGQSSASSVPSVAPAPPAPVALKDVADVRLETADAAVVRTNGRRAIAIHVTKRQDANAVSVARAAIAEAQAFGEAAGVAVDVVYDGSTAVQRSIDGLLREGVLGALLAVVVVFIFLTSLRGALTVAVSIPLSLLIAFLAMWWQAFTLNIMTLGGLAVAVGRVVDDSIVVSESILRRVHAGERLVEAARNGTADVVSPITSSTLTTVAVFLPLGVVSGLAGQVFRPFALTVSFALLASLLCAVTVIPALARSLVPRVAAGGARKAGPSGDADQPAAEGKMQRAYAGVLRWALRHRTAMLAVAGLVFAASLGAAPFIPRSFLPSEQEKLFTIHVSPPPGAGAGWLTAKLPAIEAALRDTPDVAVFQVSQGSRDDLAALSAALQGQDPNGAIFTVRLVPDADLPARIEELRRAFAPIEEGGAISIARQESASTTRLQLLVSGDDQAAVLDAGGRIVKAVATMPGLANVSSDAATTKREFAVTVDPNKALAQGLTTAQVAMQVRQMFAGPAVTRVRLGEGDPIELRVGLAKDAVSNLEDLRNLPFGAVHPRPLAEIADVREVERPSRVTHIDGRPGVSITGNIVATNTGQVADEVRRAVAALELPAGIALSYGGTIGEMEQSFAQMYLALGLAVVLVFVVMGLFFGSLVEPAVILAALPLAAIGALLALLATGRALGLPALIGLLMLIGIVVTNAIVLVDLAKRLLDAGQSVEAAIVSAGVVRLRPVLMTALATILALAPLAVGLNQGAIIAAELATVVIGGLLSSTVLTLVIVPLIYSLARRA